jgi:hypothetical protein
MNDLIVNHLLLSAVDFDRRGKWENLNTGKDIPSTADLVKFLENKCKALELLHATQLNAASTSTPEYTTSWIESKSC